jgi:hypothetical protein
MFAASSSLPSQLLQGAELLCSNVRIQTVILDLEDLED